MNTHQPIIVVVDPDADRATALSSQLDRHGHYVVRRSCGTDTLQCVAEFRPDLVLSECDLLDIERPELLHSIHEISPSTRVLFVLRQGRNPRLSETLEDGFPAQSRDAGKAEEVVQTVDRLMEGF